MIKQEHIQLWSKKWIQGHHLPTSRLVLRLPGIRDARQVFQLVQDPQVTKYMSFESPSKVEHTKAHLSQRRVRCKKGESLELVIVLQSTGKVIGSVGIMDISLKDHKAEMGYWLGREYWGNGYMPEAVTALAGFGCKNLGIEKLTIRVFDGNIASQRVAEKCGFVFEAMMKKDAFVKNKHWDVHYYAKLKK